MSLVLVDSSVWIDYFRGSKTIRVDQFDELIDNNRVCINDLILAELLPSLYMRKEKEVIDILKSIRKLPIVVKWDEIIELQRVNLRHGINNVGIPDLMIIQNVMQNGVALYTVDKHFAIMKKWHGFLLYDE